MTILMLALSVFVQDQVDNPEFKYWTTCKPGSSVTHKVGTQGLEQNNTLKTVGKDEIVVDMAIGGGNAIERKIAAKIPPEQAPKIQKEGEEEIEVGGKKLKCKWIEYDQKMGSAMAHAKAWIHEEIPGGVARIEFTMANGGKSTMVASAWERK